MDNLFQSHMAANRAFVALQAAQPDWGSIKVAELKAAAVERGVSAAGRKAELVARLQASSLEEQARASLCRGSPVVCRA